MSFLKSIFGGKRLSETDAPSAGGKAAKIAEHKGFTIEARPYKEGGQFQLAGTIVKEIDGVRREHKFIRSDRFAGLDEAAEFALVKGRQIVDERGDKVFD